MNPGRPEWISFGRPASSFTRRDVRTANKQLERGGKTETLHVPALDSTDLRRRSFWRLEKWQVVSWCIYHPNEKKHKLEILCLLLFWIFLGLLTIGTKPVQQVNTHTTYQYLNLPKGM